MATKFFSKENLQKFKSPTAIFLYIAFAFGLVTLLVTLFGGVSYVYNTDYGVEVSVSGFDLTRALLTWDFTNHNYGNIAVPFNYYARGLTITLSFFTFVGILLSLGSLVLGCMAVVTQNKKFNMMAFYAFLITAGFLLITFILSLFMGATKILSSYCGGNKACSMQSILILPAITSFVSAIMHSQFELRTRN